MSWVEAIGYLAALITIATFYMKTMVPLRVVGIVSNVTLIAHGADVIRRLSAVSWSVADSTRRASSGESGRPRWKP